MADECKEWIFCPHCECGEGCEPKGTDRYKCPTTGKIFTMEESMAAIKKRTGQA